MEASRGAGRDGRRAINLVYIPLFEEPILEARFGEPYRQYCRHVGRLIPRATPWVPRSPGEGPRRGNQFP